MSTVDSDFDLRLTGNSFLGEQRRWRVDAKPPPTPAPRTPVAEIPLATPEAPPVAASTEALPAALPRWHAVPSWMISLVVHLIFLIALGLLTLPPLLSPQETIIEAALLAPTQLEALAELALPLPLEEAPQVAVDAPAGALAELANMTDDAALSDASGAAAPHDVDAINVGELADVFGARGNGLQSIAGGQGSAEFFGVKAGGRRFVFIVDSSNSMRGQKFADAKEELLYAVRRLDKSQAFYVIFFDQDALRMFADDDQQYESRPVPATTANIRKLETWMKSVENERRTDPYDAVKIALEMLPDAMFILSDGQFTDRGRTVDYLARENVLDDPVDGPRPRVVVHTIGFYSKDGEVTLEAIAKAYKGTYRFVPPPVGKKKR